MNQASVVSTHSVRHSRALATIPATTPTSGSAGAAPSGASVVCAGARVATATKSAAASESRRRRHPRRRPAVPGECCTRVQCHIRFCMATNHASERNTDGSLRTLAAFFNSVLSAARSSRLGAATRASLVQTRVHAMQPVHCLLDSVASHCPDSF